MKIFNAILLSTVVLITSVSAQTTFTNTPPAAESKPLANRKEWRFKFNTMSILDPFSTSVNLAVEKKLGKVASFQMQGGYIFFSASMVNADNFDPETMNTSGIKLKPELRLYPSAGKQTSFLAIDFSYKNYTYDRRSEVGYFCTTGFCQVYQLVDFDINRTIIAPHFKWGKSIYLNEQNSGGFIEFCIGAGMRYFVSTPQGLPVGAEFIATPTTLFVEDAAVLTPAISFELFVGF